MFKRFSLVPGKTWCQHHATRTVIENPGAFPEGVTEKNIITHPSTPRNKFIASEQDKLQKIFLLPEPMILRYLTDNKRVALSTVQEITQTPIDEARKSCNDLVKNGLIELLGKEYMLTPKVYEAIKPDEKLMTHLR